MKEKAILFAIMFCISMLSINLCFASNTPIFDPTYNSNDGAFYANGTSITIDKNENNETIIIWNNGSQVVPSTVTIFGGGTAGSVYEETNITMNSGEVLAIVGGGVSVEENNPALVNRSSIIINDGTVLGSVTGGGLLYSEVTETTIIINNGNIAAICGGGMASATVDGIYYSIGSEEEPQNSPNRTDIVNIIINGGTINSESLNYGLLYGGGQGYSYVGETNLIINSGDMSKAYVTAGGSNGYTGSSNVEINGGDIYLFQSVNRGIVDDASVKVNGGTIEKFYVGGETEDVSVTGTINKVEAALLEGTINSLNAGKSNSQPITTNQSNYILIKTDDIDIINDNITSEEIEIIYNVDVNPKIIKINEGETAKVDISITTIPSGYEKLFNTISYSSSNEEVAIVSNDGTITGIKEGTAIITILVLDEEISCEVIVEQENDLFFLWFLLGAILLTFLLIWLSLYI